MIIDLARCIECGNCVAACSYGAIMWDEETNRLVVCTYCGYCTRYCPYGVIKLEGVVPSAR